MNGTFALYSTLAPQSNSTRGAGIFVVFWRFWGEKVDRRYIEADAFVAAADAVQARGGGRRRRARCCCSFLSFCLSLHAQSVVTLPSESVGRRCVSQNDRARVIVCDIVGRRRRC